MDTQLSDFQCLKRFRADKAIGAVSAGSIVIHFDVFEYRLSHFLPGGESLTMNGLNLERVKKALDASVIVTTRFRVRTAQQAMLLDQSLKGD